MGKFDAGYALIESNVSNDDAGEDYIRQLGCMLRHICYAGLNKGFVIFGRAASELLPHLTPLGIASWRLKTQYGCGHC